jgi:hypothetical protein
MVFMKNYNDYSQHEKALEINPNKARTGHKLMTMEQRDYLEEKREAERCS